MSGKTLEHKTMCFSEPCRCVRLALQQNGKQKIHTVNLSCHINTTVYENTVLKLSSNLSLLKSKFNFGSPSILRKNPPISPHSLLHTHTTLRYMHNIACVRKTFTLKHIFGGGGGGGLVKNLGVIAHSALRAQEGPTFSHPDFNPHQQFGWDWGDII